MIFQAEKKNPDVRKHYEKGTKLKCFSIPLGSTYFPICFTLDLGLCCHQGRNIIYLGLRTKPHNVLIIPHLPMPVV
jgi:hypothetical protein